MLFPLYLWKVNVQSKVNFIYSFGLTGIYIDILCLLGMAESAGSAESPLDKLEIMRAEKVPARQVSSMRLSYVPLPRKFDFVALEWERLANFYADDSPSIVYLR